MSKNYVSNKDETIKLFENKILESFSRVHWTVPLYIFIPIIIYLLYNSFLLYGISLTGVISYYLMGLIVWSATEYLLHRFVFHLEFKSDFGKRIHFIFHGIHHDYPKDSKRLVMPPAVSIPLALLFYFVFHSILHSILINPFLAGFLSGYLAYDMMHYAIHHYNAKNRIWLSIKNHHMLHHYRDPEKGYGVSQPFWDYIFGTTFQKKSAKDLIK